MQDITYKPFIPDRVQPEADPIKISLTESKPNIVVPRTQITTPIEGYKPKFNFKQTVSKIEPGRVVFKDNNINVGNTQDLIDKWIENGISFRVTSGLRPNAKTKQGNTSWHSQGYALDITPIEGQTFEDLANALRSKPELVK